MRTRRDGFALITVLWLVTILSTIIALGLARTRVGYVATANRVTLTRARWAASACAAIAQTRWRQDRLFDTAAIDLGRATSCRWRVVDPTSRLNVNVADPDAVRALVGDSVAARLIARRQRKPLVDAAELSEEASIPDSVLDLLTVDGPGTINVNAAPQIVLRLIPGLGPEAIERLLIDRIRSPPRSLDQLVSVLSPPARTLVLEHYSELARVLTFSAPQLVLTSRGWVGPDPERLVATVEQLVVPVSDRLAVVRQRLRT